MTLVLRYAARSDRGLIRGSNQDSVYAGPRLLAVADGMGGHAAGDVASKVVIAALEHLDDDAPTGDMLASLRNAVFDGSEHLREVIRESPELEGMGTTLTAVLFAGGRLALCHVGDSRAYLVRDGQLSQITHDDTFVQTLIDDGRITEDEANSHPQRSLLLRALNGQDVDPDLSMREARAGDRYLLCSDGLSGVVSHETMAEALRDPDPQATADRLIELALRSGGPDNITCIVADVVDDDGSSRIDRSSTAPPGTTADSARSTPAPPPAGPPWPTRGPPRRRSPPPRPAPRSDAGARCAPPCWRWPRWSCWPPRRRLLRVRRQPLVRALGRRRRRRGLPRDQRLAGRCRPLPARHPDPAGAHRPHAGRPQPGRVRHRGRRPGRRRPHPGQPARAAPAHLRDPLDLGRATTSAPTTTAPTAPTTAAPSGDPGVTVPPTSAAPTTTQPTTSSRTQEPGVDCREAD